MHEASGARGGAGLARGCGGRVDRRPGRQSGGGAVVPERSPAARVEALGHRGRVVGAGQWRRPGQRLPERRRPGSPRGSPGDDASARPCSSPPRAQAHLAARCPRRVGPQTMPVSDQAFVTLATNDVYCQGALVLGQSLRDHRATRRLVVLVTPQVSNLLREIQMIHIDTRRSETLLLTSNNGRHGECYQRLIWGEGPGPGQL